MATNNPNNPPNNPGGNNSFQNNPLQDVASIQSSLGGAADEFKEFHETAKLTSTEIKNIISLSTELNNLFKETLNFQAKIGKEYLKISSIQREINRYEEQSEKINEKINILKAKTTSAQHTQADKAIKNYKSIESLNKKILDASKEVLKTEKEIAAIKAKGGTIDPSLTRTLTNKKALLKRRTNSLSIEELALNQNLTGKDNAESSRIKQLAMLGFQQHVTAEMAQDLKAQVPAIIAANKQFEKQQKQLGSLAAIMKGISKIPILGNLIDTEKVLAAMKDKMDKTGSSWKTFGAGMKATFSEIGRLLTDPLVVGAILLDLIGKLVKGVLEFDKNITDTANSLGVSKKFTQDIYKDFENITINTLKVNEHLNNSLLSIQNQGKAMNELNAQFGTAVAFSNQQIQDQIFLTKQMGLSEDVAKGIMRYSVITGKSTNDILKTINKQNDGLLSYKKVIGEVSKISGQLLAQYKGSPEALAKAVVMADKLGISLEQAKKQSDFLLNFQGSIESEMEAELITGKQLNLERARALALMGDSAGAAIAADGTNVYGFDLSTSVSGGTVAYQKAINILSNPEAYSFDLLALPGVIEQFHSVVTALAQAMVEGRADCVYIRDLTGINETVATAVNVTAGVDSSYSATYFPWVQVKDIGSNKVIFVPPSVVVPQAYSDSCKAGSLR